MLSVSQVSIVGISYLSPFYVMCILCVCVFPAHNIDICGRQIKVIILLVLRSNKMMLYLDLVLCVFFFSLFVCFCGFFGHTWARKELKP